MNEADLKSLGFVQRPDGSWHKPKRNAGGVPSPAIPKRAVFDECLGTPSREKENASRFLVSVTSYRKRYLDPDNLCPKYFIDCLRYAEIIPNDRKQDIELSVSQKKVPQSMNEHTEIVIKRLT